MEKLAENIRTYRKLNNLSQKALAEKIGVEKSTVSHWERGFRVPSIDKMVEMAKIFNISLDDMVYDSNKKGSFVLDLRDIPTKKRASVKRKISLFTSYVKRDIGERSK